MPQRLHAKPLDDADLPRHRSGAVARMVRMPVATLRVWERRYAVARPALSPTGQRLYSAADVQRLALLKRLTDLGHAIGGLAALNMVQLQAVATTHAGALPALRVWPADADAIGSVIGNGIGSGNVSGIGIGNANPDPTLNSSPAARPAARRTCHVVMVGAALAARLQRPTLLRAWHPAVRLSGPFVDVAQAAAAVGRNAVDLLLVHEPQLHEGWLGRCDAAAPAFAQVTKALLYGFGADAVCSGLAQAGVQLLREPQPDVVVGQWLRGLTPPATAATLVSAETSAQVMLALPPAQAALLLAGHHDAWADDTVLAEIAGLSSTVACECPRHVAELLMQLSHFEAYSADCKQRSPADAALHAHLMQVAAASRALFESALERVALHDGLLLPQ